MKSHFYTIANNHSRKDRIRLVQGGKEFFQLLLQLIENATATIQLQTYIFENDETGRLVAEALMSAGRRG